jgi:hypothetical protein
VQQDNTRDYGIIEYNKDIFIDIISVPEILDLNAAFNVKLKRLRTIRR